MDTAQIVEPSVRDLKEIDDEVLDKDAIENLNNYYEGKTDSLSLFLREIGSYELLTPEQELYYLNKYKKDGDKDAKKILVNCNLRLVVSTAKRYVGHGVDIIDLVQEGSIGLMKGIDLFNPELGFKLSTYCTWWIKQAMTRYLANNSRTIRLPVHFSDMLFKYNAFVSRYFNENNGLPSVEEISSNLDISKEKVIKLMNYNENLVYLDKAVNDEDGDRSISYGDFLADDSKDPEKIAIGERLNIDLRNVMKDALSEREYNVLCLRFGLNDGNLLTLQEVGDIYHVSRERIRQIEAKALRKLKSPKRRKMLKDYNIS